MKSLALSRGTQINTEQCIENIGSRFDLVLVAAVRSREIARQHRMSGSKEHVYSNVNALLEIQNKTIDREYLKRVR